MRVCSEPGCPQLIDQSGRCPTHRRDVEHKRGSRQVRGYDNRHDRERTRWAPRVATGSILCARCMKPILPGEAWALDHDDNDRSRYLGPSHEFCNNSAGGIRSHGR